ncbi:MAG: FAD-dependent oxidoreductase, partial [Nitrososphaeria archaeon]|nr:FAD-dependent oxidoreductase [Nitrososphaeria archaeon]NIQ33793.1 FAD-dependent oxidoreductase [Nitrososphaeria archaeon]
MALYFDVVVLGAGPAGASAALKASEGGVSVLLVEKNKEIGVPIRCGEYLPVPREMEDLLPRAKHTESLYDVPEDMVRNRTSKIRIVSPAGKSYL